LILEKQLFNSD